jgi:hypothetical protein
MGGRRNLSKTLADRRRSPSSSALCSSLARSAARPPRFGFVRRTGTAIRPGGAVVRALLPEPSRAQVHRRRPSGSFGARCPARIRSGRPRRPLVRGPAGERPRSKMHINCTLGSFGARGPHPGPRLGFARRPALGARLAIESDPGRTKGRRRVRSAHPVGPTGGQNWVRSVTGHHARSQTARPSAPRDRVRSAPGHVARRDRLGSRPRRLATVSSRSVELPRNYPILSRSGRLPFWPVPVPRPRMVGFPDPPRRGPGTAALGAAGWRPRARARAIPTERPRTSPPPHCPFGLGSSTGQLNIACSST